MYSGGKYICWPGCSYSLKFCHKCTIFQSTFTSFSSYRKQKSLSTFFCLIYQIWFIWKPQAGEVISHLRRYAGFWEPFELQRSVLWILCHKCCRPFVLFFFSFQQQWTCFQSLSASWRKLCSNCCAMRAAEISAFLFLPSSANAQEHTLGVGWPHFNCGRIYTPWEKTQKMNKEKPTNTLISSKFHVKATNFFTS